MFSICPKKVYQNKDLDGTDIKVYLAIQGFANDDGFCFPSVAKIADICGVSKRTVFRSLKKLESYKVLAREQRMKNTGGNTSNVYYLKLEPNSDDVTSMSRGECQICHGGSDTDVTSNKNQYNKNIFKFTNSARVGARENGRMISAVDVERVGACKRSVEGAINYQFFISKGGEMCARAFGKLYQDNITESDIVSFFENYNQTIKIYDYNTKSLGETNIE